MIRSLLLAALLIPGVSFAGASASYTLDPLANASGGESAGSASYSVTGSTTPGGSGSSSGYAARGGYAGQLGFAQGITLSAPLLTVEEEESIQLSAELSFDDGISVAMSVSDLSWSVGSGPIAGISSSGVVTAAAVHEDSTATVHATSGGFSDDLTLTVLNTDPDNYDTYAGDGLPDNWQLQYFGQGSTKGGQDEDFDGDRIVNLIEFANGTDPSNSSAGLKPLRIVGGTLQSPGIPVIEYAPAPNVLDHRVLFIRRKDAATWNLNYSPQFSRNLGTWANATTPLTVIADDGTYEVVSVRFPVLIGGIRSTSKFFRMNLSIAPPP